MRPPRPTGSAPKRGRWDWLWVLVFLAVAGTAVYLMERYWPWSEVNLKARIDALEERVRALEEGR